MDGVREVAGRYVSPPDRALVPGVDGRPRLQATEGTTPVLPPCPGRPAPHSQDHVRHGTRDLVAALAVRAGTAIGELRLCHRSVELRQFLDTVGAHPPPELDRQRVLDDSRIHETPPVHRGLLRHPGVHLHLTPTSASWLDLVACWLTRPRPAGSPAAPSAARPPGSGSSRAR